MIADEMVTEKKYELNYEFNYFYEHTIDAKSRMFLPAKYREFVGTSVVLRMWEEGCLYLMTEEGWAEYRERVLKELADTEYRFILRRIFSTATTIPLDSQGRILIPPKFMEYAGLKDRAVIVGAGKKAEIWAPERYEIENSQHSSSEVIGILTAKGL